MKWKMAPGGRVCLVEVLSVLRELQNCITQYMGREDEALDFFGLF